MEKKKLEEVCDTATISVHIGRFESLKKKCQIPDPIQRMAAAESLSQLGALCLVVPYITFSDSIRLCRISLCHTPASCDDKQTCLQPETVAAVAEVVLRRHTSCGRKLMSQSCVDGLVYSPYWHCGRSDELQAHFADCELLPELVSVLQQLELLTTLEIKMKLCEALCIH